MAATHTAGYPCPAAHRRAVSTLTANRYHLLMKNIHAIVVKDIDGKEKPLSDFAGNVLLIVNTASKCGFTPQYKNLQRLFERYKERGFQTLAFPSNDFGRQEPGSDQEIKSFCTQTYGITFPLFSKVSVKGKGIDPLYDLLTSKETNPRFAGAIKGSFAKFLVDRKGEIVARFEPQDDPLGDKVPKAVEALLGQ